PNDVKVVFKHFPLAMHGQAKEAAYAAIAAGNQGKFWEMHDWLFANQKQMRSNASDIKSWAAGHAKELGLDIAKFKKDFDASETKKIVERDMALGQELSVRGTPHFFVNGERVTGAKPLSAFEAIVKSQLEEVKELMQGGVARADVYAKMVAENYGKDAPAKAKPSAPSGPAIEFVPVDKKDPVFGNTE